MIKVISLLQPWAQLIVLGAKKIETRSWKPSTEKLAPGDTLYIHASKRWSKSQLNLCMEDDFYNKLYGHLLPGAETPLPTGYIIGKVTYMGWKNIIADEYSTLHNEMHKPVTVEVKFGDYTPGRYGWLLKDPVLLKTFVPAVGKLSVWTHEDIEESEPEIVSSYLTVNLKK